MKGRDLLKEGSLRKPYFACRPEWEKGGGRRRREGGEGGKVQLIKEGQTESCGERRKKKTSKVQIT